MRVLVLAAALVMFAPLARGQQPPAQVQVTPTFTSAAVVSELIARARTERKADQANFTQPLIELAPYSANLEHRVAGVTATASVHERDAEMFFVVEGSGTLVTGGTLRDERRTNPNNRQGSGIEGGRALRIAKGDYVIVPEGMPHWFSEIEGALVLMSLHLPRPGSDQ